MFGNAELDGRLDAGDAILVDNIHTASGSLGFKEPYGHVDFYPNKGTRPQPGCEGLDVASECVLTYTCPCTSSQNGAEGERRIINYNALARAVSQRHFTPHSRTRS
jgi:hypothetical protein